MAPQGRSEVAQIFLQLGYDINDSDDMIRLSADLRWARERRQAQEENRNRWMAAIGSALIAIAGAAGTLLMQWLWTRMTGIKS